MPRECVDVEKVCRMSRQVWVKKCAAVRALTHVTGTLVSQNIAVIHLKVDGACELVNFHHVS